MKFAQRVEQLPPYLFAAISRLIEEKKKQGVDVISLGIGDPDLPTPVHILESLNSSSFLPENHRYPESEGLPEFREAVARWYSSRHNVMLDPSKEIVSLIGSKEGIAHLPLCFIDPGDISLITDPGYPVYEIATMFAGGSSVRLPLEEEKGWMPDLKLIDKDVIKKSKILWLNYPNNPTGAVATIEFFEEAIEWARTNDILIAHDLAYADVTFDDYIAPSILEVDGAKDVAIEFNSLSKTFNMTGWRIAMAVGNPSVIDALTRVKSNMDSGVPQAIQQMAITAMDDPRDSISEHNKIYQNRRDRVLKVLRALGLRVNTPKASLYVWAKLPEGESNSGEYAAQLVEQTGVVVTPGSSYGASGEGYIRISLTIADERLDEALARLSDFASKK
ncbi:MAG: LL-diaminopimelate aminotransferase [Chloroflexi bacterium]|nr:LL-diaminopimelate aminotransferase [Chloroflexota bacterium]|tara:strand:+ start:4658 stop:5827 length:1170 start_codon:yes stop_codon:yes gene_type:complete